MIKQNLKLFFKTKIIFIPVIILLVCFLGNLVYSCYSFSLNNDVLIYLKNSIKLCLLSFVILCFTSYEFFYLYKRCYIDEALYSHKNGKTRILTSTVTVLLFIPALEFFSAFVFNFVIFLSSGMNDYSYLYHIFSVLFLYVFLGGIIPILLGVFFAQKTKRIVSYALMALIIFLVSSTSDFIPGGLSQVTKINFWEAKYFLAYILPNDLEWYINHDYGMYAEIYRWNLIIFWISLLSFLFFKLCQIKKTALKAVLLSLTLLISTFNLVGYFYGGSHIEKGAQLDSISMSDYLFYTENEQKNQDPDFEVTSYDMDLSIYRQLDAEVSMTLSDTGLEYYNFTLYHGYNVLKITDIEGNALKYNREGDYVTVIGNGNLQLINIKYSGYSPILYSNYQACSLPGFFAYYPIPGFYKITGDYTTYNPIEIKSETEFNIRVDSARQFYSNLDEVKNEKNCFVGVTSYPTLFSGFYKSNSSYIYKIYAITVKGWGLSKIDEEYIDEIQKYINELDNNSSNKLNLKEYTIIQTNEMLSSNCIYDGIFLGDDTVFINKATDEETKKQVAEILLAQRDKGYSKYVEKAVVDSESINDN
ncbi:MAG TPA: hypothetical protein DCY01_02140 [Ruminococcus sp.]|jgi:hypothetical protein|nr:MULTISPECIES: hypothetical protein [Ruminococcus]RGH86156.1 hypothetical protein DW745_09150 [Ruminococcus sp. AM28-29LB]RGU86084.1 hypothetical protein DWW40_01330 [Ruminococcus bromii]HBA01032.1 hypothetical protein [Ruminococcus sp.]